MPFVSVADQRLEYELIAGREKRAPTLVFLHEGLGSVSLWRDFPAALSAKTGCPALIYSRRGYGKSDPGPVPRTVDYLHVEARVVLPAVLGAFGITQSVLVGHSDGASIALIAAGAGTAYGVRGLILEAPHVFVEAVTIAGIEKARAAFEQGGLRDALARHHGTNIEGAFWGWCRTWLSPAFRAWNIEEFLPNVRIPVLVIQGIGDEYGTATQVIAIANAAKGPIATELLEDCGHTPHREQSDRVLALMARFVAELPAMTR
ncbi:MAG: alpha/beta hydrolase [Alphaproteobacteria bacterium]|nr:alpha/beta hydrolase [Alphaproteobacteria bacterium]